MVLKVSKYPRRIYDDEENRAVTPISNDTVFDIKVVEACQDGNDIAWKNFYDAHFDFVFRVARRLGTPRSDIEDVVHDVFLVVYRKISDFKGGNIRSWLYRITANVVSDRHRKRRVRDAFKKLRVWFSSPSQETPERAAQRSSAAKAVAIVLQHMSPKKREVFALFEIEGVGGEEISERLEIPVNTVWTRLHHARKDFIRTAKRLGFLDEVMKK